jgi:hypothetical protein
LQNGETIGSVTVAVSGSGGASNAPVSGSPYTITASAATGGTFNTNNYAIAYYPGTLTVNPAALSVAASPQSKTYGQTLAFGSGSTLFTSTNLQNGETIGAVTLAVSNNGGAATAMASVCGPIYTITASAATGGTFNANNYTIAYYPGTLTVNPAALTVTANSTNRPYGAPNPPFTGTISNLLNGDNITETFSCIATSASPVGNYAIVPILNDPNGRLCNYSVTTNAGVLIVTPVPLLASHSSVAYQSPGTCVVSCSASYGTNSSLELLVVEPSLPPGWTLLSAGGDGSPAVNTNTGEIFFSDSLPNPLNFTYTASVPAGQTGPQMIQDTNLYWLSGMTTFTNTLANPNPLVVNYGSYLSLSRQSNAMSLTLYGDTGLNYSLQASTNLTNWTNFGALTPVGGVIQTNVTNTGGKLFFRAESSQ